MCAFVTNALIIEANLDETIKQLARNRVPSSNQKYCRWDQGDRIKYYELSWEALYPIDQKLDNLLQNDSLNMHAELLI